MVILKQLKDQLEKEIEDRKELETLFKELLKDYNYFRKKNEKESIDWKKLIDDDKKELSIKIKNVEKIKDQLLGYTLQIIAIVVAILAIIMAFSFLSTDFYSCPNEFVWFLGGATIYFLFIFTWYVLMWKRRQKTS